MTVFVLLIVSTQMSPTDFAPRMARPMQFPSASPARLGGLLGRAIDASRATHLARFIADERSPAIALFHPQCTAHNHEGDWYGEHAGKWLCAAARAVRATSDATLAASVRRVADFLVSVQDADGYLGTYAPERRFMCRRGPAPGTWDGAPAVRTWDIWVHSYLILGLLESARALAEPRYLAAARRIGDLCWRTLTEGGIAITTLGNHHGLSATVLLDPAVELFSATGERKYLELAELIVRQASEAPALPAVLICGGSLGWAASPAACRPRRARCVQWDWSFPSRWGLCRQSACPAHPPPGRSSLRPPEPT